MTNVEKLYLSDDLDFLEEKYKVLLSTITQINTMKQQGVSNEFIQIYKNILFRIEATHSLKELKELIAA